MNDHLLRTLFLIGAGLFTFAGGFFGWSWFLNHYRAKLFVKLFGRAGTRAIYMIFGVVLFLTGVADAAGLLR